MSDTLTLQPSRDSLKLEKAAGIPGEAATVEVGTVTGLPSGSTPTVTNSGTAYNAVLNFGVVAGADGTNGADGADGDLVGPGAGVTDGHGVVWNGTTGAVVKTLGAAPLTAAAIGVTLQAYDADTTKNDVADQVITGGAVITSLSLGTVTTGTTTLDFGARPQQHYTNNGAHTLAPDTSSGSILLDITNDASAGAITTSGWTKVVGSFTTTNGHKFRCSCSVGNAGSLLQIQAMQ